MEKWPYIAIHDFESKLIPCNEVTNSTSKHEAISYMYSIHDRDGKIVRTKIETGGENLGRKLVLNLLSDYKQLYEIESSKWNRKPELTEKDLKNFVAQANCEKCGLLFGST